MKAKEYRGAIIEESLEDKSILDLFSIIDTHVTDDVDPNDRWHIHTVKTDKGLLIKLSYVLKPEKYYAHFWDDEKNIIAIFRDKVFEFNYDKKEEWLPAVEYGVSVGIPREQLDFLID